MIAILQSTNISTGVENFTNSQAISGDLRLDPDIFEQQSHQSDLINGSCQYGFSFTLII